MLKGSGTVNREGDYGLILTAIDGNVAGGGGADEFRIMIWDKSSGSVLYDNQRGSPNGDNPTTEIDVGNIVVHR